MVLDSLAGVGLEDVDEIQKVPKSLQSQGDTESAMACPWIATKIRKRRAEVWPVSQSR